MAEHVVIEKHVHERLLRRSRGLTKTRIFCAAMIVLFTALLLAVSWQRGAMKANKPPIPVPVVRVL
jgi:hypothetical protein